MPEIDTKVSLMSIVQLAVLLVAIVLAWSKMVTREELVMNIKEVKTDYVRSDVFNLQIGILDTKIESVDKKVNEIGQDVKSIRKVVQ